jgi:hypothetical protein
MMFNLKLAIFVNENSLNYLKNMNLISSEYTVLQKYRVSVNLVFHYIVVIVNKSDNIGIYHFLEFMHISQEPIDEVS